MKETNFLKDFKYAHRGLFNNNDNIPENSTIAYINAIKEGYAIELDVTATKDNKYVCFHDSNLLRMTNNNIDIESITYEELLEFKLLDSKEQVPLFSDILKIVGGKVPLLIEIKSHKNYKKKLKILTSLLDNYNYPFAVFSFDFRIVYWFKKNRPNYIRGQISSFFADSKLPKMPKWFLKSMWFNKFTKPDFISYNILNVPNKYINREKNKNRIIFGYTAKSINEYNDKIKYLDNIVFEGFKL